MKVKSWIPLTIIGIGLILLGIGMWQQKNVKIKTAETLNIAKNMVKEHSRTPIEDELC